MIFFLITTLAYAANNDFLTDLDTFRARSPVIRSEKSQLEANSTATLSRLLQFSPAVSLGIGRQREKTQAPALTTETSYSFWRASGEWNLFRGGRDFFFWRAAREAELSQKFEVESQELKIELSGASLIFRRLYLRDVQGAQSELLKLKQETIRIGQSRYRQGKIPLQDVSKMEVDLSQQQNAVRQSEIDLSENEAAYRALFVDELHTKVWPFSEDQRLFLADEGIGSLDQRRLNLKAKSLHDLSTAAKLQHMPSLDFNLSYRDYPLSGPSTRVWAGVLELSFPLWSRFEIASESAQAIASAERAENEAMVNARTEEARRNFVKQKISLSQKNFEEAKVNLEKSDRLYRDMLRSFQLGRLSTNDLFLEQDRRIRALLLFTQSRLSFHESLMEACALWGLSARACLR